jgi:hypothetical protein
MSKNDKGPLRGLTEHTGKLTPAGDGASAGRR